MFNAFALIVTCDVNPLTIYQHQLHGEQVIERRTDEHLELDAGRHRGSDGNGDGSEFRIVGFPDASFTNVSFPDAFDGSVSVTFSLSYVTLKSCELPS